MRWIIGDIHGMCKPLAAVLKEIDRRDAKRQLIFAGDYVNRGPESKQVIELLLGVAGATFLRGNHDDVFDQVLHDQCYLNKPDVEERLAAFKWFMDFGLYQTFESYGADATMLLAAARKPSVHLLDELGALVPKKHHEFIKALEPAFEDDEFFVAHAKWDPERSTDDICKQVERFAGLRQTLLWGRYNESEIAAEKKWSRRGYFGHTPVTVYGDGASPVPIMGPKIVLIDTGAALPEGRRLTAFCHETDEFLQADPSGIIVKA